MNTGPAIAATLFLALLGGMADASQQGPPPAKAEAPLPRAAGWRADLDLRYWQGDRFYPDMVATVQRLAASHGPEQTAVILDAAELYLTHMLLYEAGSTLAGLSPARPDHLRRHRALQDARALLNGEALEDFASSPLAEVERPDRAFWQSLIAIATSNVQLLTDSIEDSFAGLAMQSRAVLTDLLPVFVEAAIETRHFDYADAALDLMKELPELDQSPTGYFLRGRAAERRRNNATALEAYLKGATGRDRYAVRARIAVADMSLEDGGKGALLAAKSVLVDGLESWRGDQYEIEVLKRLARVQSQLEDDNDALITRGRLIVRFPTSGEAQVALEEAKVGLAAYYQKGADGGLSLSGWTDAHLKFLPYYRHLPSFPDLTEVLADHLLQMGATDLATREYMRALRLLPEDASADEARLRLGLKLGRAQLRSGLAQAAKTTLEALTPAPGSPAEEERARLLASALVDLGERDSLMTTRVTAPEVDHLRAIARVHADNGTWDAARDTLVRFWKAHPESFSVQDATRLLIAANRTEDAKTRDRVIAAFPTLTEDQTLVELATSLQAETPSIFPLRADQAAARLQKMEQALESIEKSGISASGSKE